MNIDYVLERTSRSSTPEVKLWSAVIATALRDPWSKPSKSGRLDEDVSTAFRYLMTNDSTWAIEAVGLDAETFRERVQTMMIRGEDFKWRNARLNYNVYLNGSRPMKRVSK